MEGPRAGASLKTHRDRDRERERERESTQQDVSDKGKNVVGGNGERC